MAKHQHTRESRVAQQLGKLVNDIELDLDMVGKHIGHTAHGVLYNRLDYIMDTAKDIREYGNTREYHEEQLRRLGHG